MNAYLYYRPNQQHQLDAMFQLSKGFMRHGITPNLYPDWSNYQCGDFVVCWGDKVPAHIDRPRLILEAGYINGRSGHYVEDRLLFVSAGWNGLHGRADPLRSDRPPDRWNSLGIELKPWKHDGAYVETALICDQHPGDQQAGPLKWWEPIADGLIRSGVSNVRYRPHPLFTPDLPPLNESLQEADLCVTWSSTCAVEAVIAGVPTITRSQGSVAWDITSHSLDTPLYVGPREQWAYNLAYRQFTSDELKDGTAWEVLQDGLTTNERAN